LTVLSLVIVSHRSAATVGTAIASFRAEAQRLGISAEVVVVDQSEDAAQARQVRGAGADTVLDRPNRGYAAGLNTGLGVAAGTVVFLANADLEFRPGSVGALLDALSGPWSIVGPQFELAGWRFPPADEQSPRAALRRWLVARAAGSSPLAWRRSYRQQVGRWEQVWRATEPVEVPTLSGALLALRAETAALLGPLDEEYFLYFEETDWLRRARRRGMRLAVVPRAGVEHRFGGSTGALMRPELFAASKRRYFRRWFGRRGDWVARLPAVARHALPPSDGAASCAVDGFWLLSPSPSGLPGVGRRCAQENEAAPWEAARDFAAAGEPRATWTLLASDRSGVRYIDSVAPAAR
jgi:hypothetical protein